MSKYIRNIGIFTAGALLITAPSIIFAGDLSDSKMDGHHMGAMVNGSSYDSKKSTITLPLHKGSLKSGETVWYLLLEASDKSAAKEAGINFVGKLKYIDVNNLVRKGSIGKENGLVFDAGGVDFTPKRSLEPGDAPNFSHLKSSTLAHLEMITIRPM